MNSDDLAGISDDGPVETYDQEVYGDILFDCADNVPVVCDVLGETCDVPWEISAYREIP